MELAEGKNVRAAISHIKRRLDGKMRVSTDRREA